MLLIWNFEHRRDEFGNLLRFLGCDFHEFSYILHIFHDFWDFLNFQRLSAVSTPPLARVGAFFSIFREIQKWRCQKERDKTMKMFIMNLTLLLISVDLVQKIWKPSKTRIFMKFSTKNFISSEDRLKCRKWPTYRLRFLGCDFHEFSYILHIFHDFWDFLNFQRLSAVSTPPLARVGAFFSIFREIQKWRCQKERDKTMKMFIMNLTLLLISVDLVQKIWKPSKTRIFMKFSTKNFISSEDRLKCRKWPTYRLVDCRIRRAYVVSKFSTLKVLNFNQFS